MANETVIVTKNSTTTTNAPSDLLEGELAVNIPDKRLFVGPVGGGAGVSLTDADAISYNNSASGLTATNIQLAIDEVDATVDTKADQSIVDGKANTADLGELAYENDTGVDTKQYVRKDNAWAELVESPSVNPNRFLFGKINANATTAKGSGGFTCAKGGTGIYNITFNSGVTEEYVVVVSPVDASLNNMPWVNSETTAGFVVYTRYGGDDPGLLRDWPFSFQLQYVVTT